MKQLEAPSMINEAIDYESIIKSMYIEKINSLISFYEIYKHDIPADIVEEIVIVFQCYCQAQLSNNPNEMYEITYKKCNVICHKLHCLLINTYWKQIKFLRKFSHQFNYKGVNLLDEDIIANEPEKMFWQKSQKMYKTLKEHLKNIEKRKKNWKKLEYNKLIDDNKENK